MAAAVALVVTWLPWQLLLPMLLVLVAKSVVCGGVFAGTLTLLWWLSGRPAGFEAAALKAGQKALRRV